MSTQYDDIQRRATTGGGEGDTAQSSEDIRTYVLDELSAIGVIHDDLGDIPASASNRPNGTFRDIGDLEQYLDGGGLLLRDGDGNFIQNPIVHIFYHDDEFYDGDIYEVWIDDTTP